MPRPRKAREISVAPASGDTTAADKLEDRVENLAHDLVAALARLKRERAKRSDALRESQEIFRQFFDHYEDALLLFDPGSGDVIDANPAAASLLGYSRDELIDKGTSLFIEPEELRNLSGIISQVDTGQTKRILSYRKREGQKRIASFRVSALSLHDKDAVLFSFRDITDEIRSKTEARARHAQLVYTHRMASIGILLPQLADEMNAANNPVMYNTQLLSDVWHDALPVLESHYREKGDFPLGGPLLPFSEMKDVVPKLLAEIKESTLRIRKIVDVLEETSRSVGSMPDKDVDLNGVIRDVVSVLGDQIHKYAERVHLALAEDLPPVKGDPRKLEHVFVNLMMNALRSLPNRHCSVRISTQFIAENNSAEITVRDEGVGMSKDMLNRLTGPFLSTKLGSGTGGLGLHAAYSILREHSAVIQFDSDPGKGTTVIIRIPCAGS